MDPVRIVHIISSLNRGGRERQLSVIIFNTDHNRYPSRIIYFNEAQNNYLDEYRLGEYSIRIKALLFFQRLLELNKLLKEYRPDIVFTWGNLESFFILLLWPFHKFKFINGSVRHGIRSIKVSHYFRSLILHLSPFIVANSFAGLRSNHLKRGYVLRNGIDDKFFGKNDSEQKIKKRIELFGIDEKQTLLISVGNMVPYKDYLSVLFALKLLKGEGYLFYYLILGDGPRRGIIERKIAELNLTKNVKILGNVQNVQEYLQISDIFIHSSKGEGCSNAILEAMAARLPVIASNVGGIPEIVYPASSMFFPFMDGRALFNCLLHAEEVFEDFDPESKEYKKHIENFSLTTMIKNFYNIIDIISNNSVDV